MTIIKVKNGGKDVTINLPNDVKEINVKYLQAVSKDYNVGDNRSLIAIIFQTSLAVALNTNAKRKDQTVGVVPMFIKSGKTEVDFINQINPGDILTVGAGDIEQGHHVNFPHNSLLANKVLSRIANDEYMSENSKMSKAMSEHFMDNRQVCFISFKVINNNDIVGVYQKDTFKPTDDTYVIEHSVLTD